MDLLGFATTFFPDDVKLIGQSYLEECGSDEIRGLLKRKLLIDGAAANFLVERGFGPQVGLKSCDPVGGTNYERFVNRDFAGKFLNSDEACVFGDKYRMGLMEGAIVVSTMFGPAASYSSREWCSQKTLPEGEQGLFPSAVPTVTSTRSNFAIGNGSTP